VTICIAFARIADADGTIPPTSVTAVRFCLAVVLERVSPSSHGGRPRGPQRGELACCLCFDVTGVNGSSPVVASYPKTEVLAVVGRLL
jgi:hypothetical protein